MTENADANSQTSCSMPKVSIFDNIEGEDVITNSDHIAQLKWIRDEINSIKIMGFLRDEESAVQTELAVLRNLLTEAIGDE